MIIGKTGITTTVVAQALETSSRNISVLCRHKNINPWSKWKPIKSDVPTMTLDELKRRKYGLEVIEANTVKQLVSAIKQNENIGYKYPKPTLCRLGDFRNYSTDAPVTTGPTYIDNEEVKIGGVSPNNHPYYEREMQGLETRPSETFIGVEDLYNKSITGGLRRGAFLTDGTNEVWYTEKFFWWTPEMQKFSGKTISVYEFYTNTNNKPGKAHISNGSDRYFAIPFPFYKLRINGSSPAGSKLVQIVCTAEFRDSSNAIVDYKIYFSAVGEVYRGGELTNVSVVLTRDRAGENILSTKNISSRIYVANETTSDTYSGWLENKADRPGQSSPTIAYVQIFFNNLRQDTVDVLMKRPGRD